VSKALSSWLGLSLCTLGYFCATNNPASAQVTSDETVNTQVTENGNTAEITGGETRGDNLFHSFQDFSVPTGNEASFLNANDISNIFSRVTGGDISNIDGLISANGSANLFLINPAGIVFGEGARLDIGGSFYGSSASSILFEDGEFSATDLDNPPLLTINAPIGLGFRDEPGDIVNRSTAINPATNTLGLEVNPENNINLVGGNINFEGGRLNAPAGKVQLGGLSTAGTVGITNEGNLSFPDEVPRGNVSLTQEALIDVTGTRGGDIEFTAADIQIRGGSFLQGGAFVDVGLADSQSGNINFNATGVINVNGSTIDNSSGIGNAGNIQIDAQDSILLNNAAIGSPNAGTGLAGDINLNAPNEVSIKDSTIAADGNLGRIFIGDTVQPSQVTLEGERTETEDGTNFAFSNQLSTNSFNSDDLLGGIFIKARDRINIIDTDIQSSATTTRLDRDSADPKQLNNNFSAIALNVDGENPLGNISIERSQIDTTNFSTGFAGNIEFNAPNEVSIKDSTVAADGNFGFITIGDPVQPSQVTLEGERTGDNPNFEYSNTLSTTSYNPDDLLGGISINARDRINIIGTNIESSTQTTRTTDINEQKDLNFSIIDLLVDAENPRGTIKIERSQIDTSNSSTGFAGNININAREKIDITDTENFSTGKVGNILIGASDENGETSSPQEVNVNESELTISNQDVTADENQPINAGTISINAINNISLVNNSEIRTLTERLGNAGNLTVQSENGNVSFDNSKVFSNVEFEGVGNAGNINITANSISFLNGSELQSITRGFGNAGNVTVQAENGNASFDNSTVFSTVEAEGIGFAGDINITANSISFLNGSQLQSSNRGSGNGGNIALNARENIVLSGRSPSDNSDNFASAIFTDSTSLGNAGNIQVNVSDGSLSLSDGATLYSGYNGLVDAGESNGGESNAGEITIDADLVSLDGNSIISTQAFGDNANGGNLKIDANYIIAFPSNGTGNDLVSTADQGRGGDIDLTVEQLFGLERGDAINDEGIFIDNEKNNNNIDASSNVFGLDGTININTSNINPVQGATELPSNVVEPEQTTAQTCDAGRGTAGNNLAIAGKGGVPPAPDTPLNSENIISGEQNPAAFAIPEPIETSQGKIQPARGIKVSESGKISLTAYRTNNAGERIPEIRPNCNSY
jgi:filamentous hemagglutinin family protein